MEEYKNRRVPWYNFYNSSYGTNSRLRIPIHYYLQKHDYITARKYFYKGADPALLDDCRRTALDVAVQMFIQLLETILCTSFPLDFLDDELMEREFFSCLICKEEKKHDNKIESPGSYSAKKPTKTDFPFGFNKEVLCQHQKNSVFLASEKTPCFSNNISKGFRLENLENGIPNKNDKSVVFPLPIIAECVNNDRKIKECCQLNEDHILQQDVLIVVENIIHKDIPKKIMARMNELLRRLKGLFNIIKLFLQFACLRDSAAEKVNELTKYIRYPFFYNALLYFSFKLFPKKPSGHFWQAENPADARRLVNIILFKKLKFYEFYKYLQTAAKYMQELVNIFGITIFQSQSVAVTECWLHLSFVLDIPEFFETICIFRPQLFSCKNFYNWDSLFFDLIKLKNKFPRFIGALHQAKLKSTIQKRFYDHDEEDNCETESKEKLTLPFEERYLKKNVIDNYKTFHRDEAKDLVRVLKEWKYAACR